MTRTLSPSLAASSLLVLAAATAHSDPPPAAAAPAARADPDPAAPDEAEDRRALFAEARTGGGSGIGAEIRVGWMLRSWIGAFASADAVLSGEAGARLLGVGLRMSYGRMLIDARAMRGTWEFLCDDHPSDVCMTDHRIYGAVGVGLEVLRRRHVALELELERMQGRSEGFTLLSFGIGVFL